MATKKAAKSSAKKSAKSAAKKSSAKKPTAKKAAAKKPAARKSAATKSSTPSKSTRPSTTPPSKRWSGKVKTDSTKPAPGLFNKSGKAIAEGLAKKSVSPKGPGQAVRMLNFYENRGGKNLSTERKGALERAKTILHKKVEESKES